jgi:PPP family 3-phenylpropionic acid transporter
MGVQGLLWLAVVGGSIRWVVMVFPIDIDWLFGLQMLHAFTFAATHLAMTQFISHKVPDQLTASAQTFYDALAMGAFMGVTMTLAGSLYGIMEGYVYWLMALLSITAGLVLSRCNSN